MRHRYSFVAVIASLIVFGGCAKPRSGFDISSSDFDVSPLVGRWDGTFSSAQTGRHGTITFTVEPREVTGSGEVILLQDMIAGDTTSTDPRPSASSSTAEGRLPLKISLMRIEGANVVGRIEPTLDPLCRCRISSTFTGTLRGNTIQGTYSAVGSEDGRELYRGIWKVTRVKRL